MATVHIRYQLQSKATTITGLPTKYDPAAVLKALKKDCACNGSLVNNRELGTVIQAQGDQRRIAQDCLVRLGVPKSAIVVHGA